MDPVLPRTTDHGAASGEVIGYLRVSTDEQVLGPTAQLAAIRAWCAREGLMLGRVYEDRVSGGAPLEDRPGLMEVVAAVSRGTTIVVAKRDRLARDVLIAAMVDHAVARAGGRIVSADGSSVDSGPEGQLMRRILDAFAEYERAMIRSRTRAALRAKRKAGFRTGAVPYGYQVTGPEGRLVIDPAEWRAVEYILGARARGEPFARIVEALNAEPSYPPRGERWHATTVARIAKAQTLAGVDERTQSPSGGAAQIQAKTDPPRV